jgi:hypothetical protein
VHELDLLLVVVVVEQAVLEGVDLLGEALRPVEADALAQVLGRAVGRGDGRGRLAGSMFTGEA